MEGETILGEDVARFVRLMAPGRDDVLAEIEAENRDRGFPMVGPEVGGALSMLARLADARRVFEFGSGLGYSAYWFARALPEDGLVVLTEEDEAELETARSFFERGGYADRAAFEAGDAHETFARYDGPFDVVFIDHHKARYPEAFAAAREKLAPGGVIVADNVMSLDGESLLGGLNAFLSGGDSDERPPDGADDPDVAGIEAYLDAARSDPGIETVALPLGSGITVSVKR